MKFRMSPTSRKHAVIAVVALLIPMIPGVLLFPLGLAQTVGLFICGVLAGVLCAAVAGLRVSLGLTAILTLATFIAFLAAPSPVLAGLVMAASAGLYGLSSRRGLMGVVTAAPITITFTLADPPKVLTDGTDVQSAVVLAVVVLAGTLWGVLVGWFLTRSRTRPPVQASPVNVAILQGIVLAIATGVMMTIVVANNLQHGGAWVILTMLVIVQPALAASYHKARQRTIGTVIGFVLAFGFALVLPTGWPSLVVGLVFFALTVYVKLDSTRSYWQFTMFLTPGIVLVEGATTSVLSTDVTRLICTLIGVAISLVFIAIVNWYCKLKPPAQAKPA